MEKKNSLSAQQARISDLEKELLKNTIGGREEILLAVRNLFFGFKLSKEEQELIKGTFKSPEVRKLMRKIFLPELDNSDPIGQSIDLWMTVQLEGKSEEEQEAQIMGRERLIEMLETALALLEGGKETVDLTFDTRLGSHSTLLARNTFITHIQLQLGVIRALCQEQETLEEKAERIKRDSSK